MFASAKGKSKDVTSLKAISKVILHRTKYISGIESRFLWLHGYLGHDLLPKCTNVVKKKTLQRMFSSLLKIS